MMQMITHTLPVPDCALSEMADTLSQVGYNPDFEEEVTALLPAIQNQASILKRWLRTLSILLGDDAAFFKEASEAMRLCDGEQITAMLAEGATSKNPDINFTSVYTRLIIRQLLSDHPNVVEKLHRSFLEMLRQETSALT